MLAIRLPNNIEIRLANPAETTERTKTFYTREAILKHVEYLEHRYLAEERLETMAKRWFLDDLELDADVDG